jgi:phosphohistidine phosphatase
VTAEQPATERTLVVLRHAKSDWSGGEPDVRRPLAARGRRQAAEAGRWLAGNLGTIDLAVVSPAERARRTWELASVEVAEPVPMRSEERAYAASSGTLLDLVRDLTDDLGTVVLVGHNPGVEDLVTTLTGRWVAMPTSCLAVIALTGPWASAGPSSGELRAFGRPPTAVAS